MRELLRDRTGTDATESTIWRALRRSGFTMKAVMISASKTVFPLILDCQITKDALERSELKRGLFRVRYGNQYTPEQTVFVDESSFDRRTAIRGRAWALSGQRAVRKCFFVRGRR